jgi:M6 family metalloprotease-like protein
MHHIQVFMSRTIIFAFIILCGCDKPDRIERGYCRAGALLTGIDQSNVPDSVKTMVYGTNTFGQLGSWYNVSTKQTSRKLVILPVAYVGIPGNTFVTEPVIRNAFFSTVTGSVRNYFFDNSWGNFELQEGAINNSWINLPSSTTQYGLGQTGGDFTRNAKLPSDACTGSKVNWAAIDVNGDRIITRDESVVCILSPLGQRGACRSLNVSFLLGNTTYTIPPSNPICYIDCRTNDTKTGSDDISYNYPTIWHELCHAMFDLPDRYATFCGTGPTGSYDLMSNNCSRVYMNIVDKIKLGWITPPILMDGNTTTCYRFNPSQRVPSALILWNRKVPRQYFVLENRLRESARFEYDNGSVNDGLAVWWVDENNPDIQKRISLVDARTASSFLTNDPTVQSTSYYAGGEKGVFFQNILCVTENCPIIFLRYGAGASSGTNILHGIRAVSSAAWDLEAAVF